MTTVRFHSTRRQRASANPKDNSVNTATISLASLLGATALASIGAPALAQTLPSPPLPTQAFAADTRQGSTFNDNGASIFYQVTGTGTPLVLVHGYPLNGALFAYQQAALSGQFEVVTLDLPGFGRSTAPAGFGTTKPGSTAVYAKYVLDLMTHLGINSAIVGGHSMGGLITQEIYREAPQRVLGLILIDTVAFGAAPIEVGEWAGYGVQATKFGVPSIINTVTPQLLTGTTRLNNSATTTAIEDMIAEGSVAGAQAGAETLALRPSYTAQLALTNVPVLVIEGLEDPVYGFPISQAIAKAVPHGTLALIPGAAHVSIFEQPQAANTAIENWAAANNL